MDYEHLMATTARGFELADVSVLVLGAVIAAVIFTRRISHRATFQVA